MRIVEISRPNGGIIHLPGRLLALLLFAFALALPAAAQGKGGLVNLPGGGAAVAAFATVPTTIGDVTGAWLFFGEEDHIRAEFRDCRGNVLHAINSADKDQSLVTKWPDRNNPKIIHEVVTTYGGRTNGALVAAAERHKAAVDQMQRLFPPPAGGS